MADKKSKTKKTIKKKQAYDFYKLPRNEMTTLKVLPGIYSFEQIYVMPDKVVKKTRFAANVLIDGQSKIWIFGPSVAKSLIDFYALKALSSRATITVNVLFTYDLSHPLKTTYDVVFRDSEITYKGQHFSAKQYAKEDHYINFGH